MHTSIVGLLAQFALACSPISSLLSSHINIGILACHPTTMRLLDQVHEACVTKHYSPRTEEAYTRWINHFLRFHRGKAGKWTHPRDMTADHVELFLTHLAVRRRVAASTQNQALNALVFLFRDVVKKELGEFDAVRAKRPRVGAGAHVGGAQETVCSEGARMAVSVSISPGIPGTQYPFRGQCEANLYYVPELRVRLPEFR